MRRTRTRRTKPQRSMIGYRSTDIDHRLETIRDQLNRVENALKQENESFARLRAAKLEQLDELHDILERLALEEKRLTESSGTER